MPRATALFPIVGVGASAGGMEAFTELLQQLPPDSGMAFVLIQHLDPKHPSYLSEVLARSTQLPVAEIQDGMVVQPNHVYVSPANADVGLLNGALVLLPRSDEGRRPHLSIDFFFRALAADQGSQALAVVLSGTASDGSEGLRAIKAEGGVTFAQAPLTAKFGGMPDAAIRTGAVDFALPIPELALELLRIGHHPGLHQRESELFTSPEESSALKQVLVLIRSAVGVDFAEYKQSSIRRRLARRMALLHLTSLEEYVQLLRQDPGAAQVLFEDILIHVTSFFRNPEAFDALREQIFPELLKQKRQAGPIRIWSAGCSTGEEAYSLLISLLDYLGQQGAHAVPVQLFGTDVSEKAIEKARAGFYSDAAVRELGPDRLARYFTRMEGGGYRINKAVRERCAFVKHDLARDPPFSKLDLVVCRNVLIYFSPELQKRVLATFQFALNQPGFLMLGHAENISDVGHLFSVTDKDHKLFARTASRSQFRLAPTRALSGFIPPPDPGARPGPPADVVRRTESLLLDRYAPAGVVVNERMEILHFRGRTGLYLEPAPGQPQYDLLKMARKGLMAELRIGLSQATKEQAVVRRAGVRFEHDGSPRICDLVIVPIASPPEARERVFAVLFEEIPAAAQPVLLPGPGPEQVGPPDDPGHVAKLEAELAASKAYLHSIIEEHQRTNEELMSANEELVSSNEELQSLNEELETAKEELQSTNEELTTLNDELQSRNGELNVANSDLVNILGSVEVPIVILDLNRRIRRFTPKARTILNLLPSDVGRPLNDIRPSLAVEKLDQKIAATIDSVSLHEEEVRDQDGRWYRLQIRPYATIDKRIDGAVLSIVDVDVLKRALGAAEWARDYARTVVGAMDTPFLVLDQHLKVLSSNEAFHESYGRPEVEPGTRSLYAVMGGFWDFPQLQAALRKVQQGDGRFQSLEVERELPGRGTRSLNLSARAVSTPSSEGLILLAAEDITDRKRAERERASLLEETRAAQASAEEANRAKDQFLATLSHELRTPLSSLLLQAQLLRRGVMDPARLLKASETIERATKMQAQLIDDLLDISRIVTGKLRMDRRDVSLAETVQAAVDTLATAAEARQVQLEVMLDASLPPVSGDPGRLQQAVLNLLTNALKFTPSGSRVKVTVDSVGPWGRIQVRDSGIGIEPEFLPHLFNRFSQEEVGETRKHGGLGLGLAIVRYLVEAHGGTVRAESEGRGQGACFTLHLPLQVGKPAPTPVAEVVHPSNWADGSLRGARILVVEDDVGTREALTEMLAFSGAEVRPTGSAAQAMELFETFRPDLMVSDIAMPQEDGYSLLARIRALGKAEGGEVPAVALTAMATEVDQHRALSAGFQRHLAKPVDIDKLVQVLTELWAPRRPDRTGPRRALAAEATKKKEEGGA